MTIPELLASAQSIYNMNLPRERGIYFLILRNEIVYVGKSVRISSRIKDHLDSIKMFDRVAYHLCKDNDAMEIKCIQLLSPIYNHAHSQQDHIDSLNIEPTFKLIKKYNLSKKEILNRYNLSDIYKIFVYASKL